MKKKIATLLAAVMMLICMSGCNRQVFDTTYKYDRAIISLPNGEVIDGKVQSWRDYENSDQIQVKIDGVTYLVHSSNIVLIAE
jgi:ribosomal protein S1